jgi:hypothetical protein
MKRCIGSYKETQCFKFIHVGILYKQKGIVEGECLCGLIQKIKKHRQSPRKNLKHSHEVRVEGRSKGGLESSTG